MILALFGSGRQRQQFVAINLIPGVNVGNMGQFERQCPRLVKDHGVDLVEQL